MGLRGSMHDVDVLWPRGPCGCGWCLGLCGCMRGDVVSRPWGLCGSDWWETSGACVPRCDIRVIVNGQRVPDTSSRGKLGCCGRSVGQGI